uniref:c-SKI SMAD4-binding domain-containing protein n=1 Tax=Glossina pallidipes TaxID=7398 RepID=A0A1B0A2S2_GLOPL
MKASQQPPCIADLCLHMPTAMTTKETVNITRTSVGGSTTVARNVITPQTLTVKSITQISPGIPPNLSSGLHRTNSSFAAQKSNQVSTVLLCGIPIVSLHIEGQERLCLAQISNTLLKQFSYNEIHNRRVALGITCVQCTPVQLEILRRAGAMPVSSRRCGMITRREAERLCKSFLGNNTPPRLPEDFAFNVQHKCAWGCRGSFLPARYNSSRAKCIKCQYCGVFFSPNKFIFHSHRLSQNDKYVQPDAANFNSWRRHMMLTGQPLQEVVYAWEDVKAMFNGGTRKRLMGNAIGRASPGAQNHQSSTNSGQVRQVNINQQQQSSNGSNQAALICPVAKRLKGEKQDLSTATTEATAVVGVTGTAIGPSRSINQNYQSVNAATATSDITDNDCYNGNGNDMSILPFSRSLMMDYVWQHAQAAKQSFVQHQHLIHHNSQLSQAQQQQPRLKDSTAFTLPWIKPTDCSSITAHPVINNKTSQNGIIDSTVPQLINPSAFKPVLHHENAIEAIKCAAVSAAASTASLILPSGITNRLIDKFPGEPTSLALAIHTNIEQQSETHTAPPYQNLSSPTFAVHSVKRFKHNRNGTLKEYLFPSDNCLENQSEAKVKLSDKRYEASSSEDHLPMEEDVLVDIETTEDDKPVQLIFGPNIGELEGDTNSTDEDDDIDVVCHDIGESESIRVAMTRNPVLLGNHSSDNESDGNLRYPNHDDKDDEIDFVIDNKNATQNEVDDVHTNLVTRQQDYLTSLTINASSKNFRNEYGSSECLHKHTSPSCQLEQKINKTNFLQIEGNITALNTIRFQKNMKFVFSIYYRDSNSNLSYGFPNDNGRNLLAATST